MRDVRICADGNGSAFAEATADKEKFTPGPWEVSLLVCPPNTTFTGRALRVISKIGGDTGKDVCFVCGRDFKTAALIAAAPEMYEALSEAVERYGKPGGPWNVPSEPGSWIEKAKEALKKARDEE